MDAIQVISVVSDPVCSAKQSEFLTLSNHKVHTERIWVKWVSSSLCCCRVLEVYVCTSRKISSSQASSRSWEACRVVLWWPAIWRAAPHFRKFAYIRISQKICCWHIYIYYVSVKIPGVFLTTIINISPLEHVLDLLRSFPQQNMPEKSLKGGTQGAS